MSTRTKSKTLKKEKLKVVDLFAGCGGFSHGFKKAGYEIVAANEYWEPAQQTYARNHKGTKLIKGDIKLPETKKELINSLKNKKIDVIIGGPPCQAFSMAGKRDPNDPRAQLYKDYIEIIKEIQPNSFVMENVKGILSAKDKKGHKIYDKIISEMKKLDYEITEDVYRASDYRVPQKRERVMVIGIKKELNKKFVKPKNKKEATVKEAIEDLISKPEGYVPNHIFSKHSPTFIEKIKNTEIGKSIYNTFSDAYHKCPPNEPSRTVKENHGSVFLHYKENRVMTPRELARLQSFDDKFIFESTKGNILKQIGNAVPPLLAKTIALELKKLLTK